MYITQDVFDASAIAVALGHFLGQDKGAIASELANTHERTYRDTELRDDILRAAEQVIELLPHLFKNLQPDGRALAGACETLYKAIVEFDETGRRRSKFFRGALFGKQKSPINDKVERNLKNVVLYHMLVVSHKIDVRKF